MTYSLSVYVLRYNLILVLNAFIWCISCYHSSHSCTCIVASHLGTLDAQCMDVKHMIMDSNQKMVLVDLSQRWKDPWSACLEWKMFPKTVQANWTDFVLDPRQAPDHSKPLMFLQISLASFMFDALGYRSWLETLDAYNFLVQKYTLNPMYMLSHA